MVIYDVQGQAQSARCLVLLWNSGGGLKLVRRKVLKFCQVYLQSPPRKPSFILFAPEALISKSQIKALFYFGDEVSEYPFS